MTAYNTDYLAAAKDFDDLAHRLRKISWAASTGLSAKGQTTFIVVTFEQRNKVHGKVTRRPFGRIRFQCILSFDEQ